MAAVDAVEAGRHAFEHQGWATAFTRLSEADRQAPLDPEDTARLAVAAYLTDRVEEALTLWTRAHHEFLARGDVPPAMRCAFWVAMISLLLSEVSQASGWVARSRRLLDTAATDCVEQGYMLIPASLLLYWHQDNPSGAHELNRQALGIAERFGDSDLGAISRLGMGETLVSMGRPAEGLVMLDEAMAAVTAGEVSSMVTGIVYCAVLTCCNSVYDVRRAQEWTAAFGRWCESQPDLVPYRGECMVDRARIMRLHGAWRDALEEAKRAVQLMLGPVNRAHADAYYLQGEVYRLRGELESAEEAYKLAAEHGPEPQPGLALLRMAQGNLSAAVASISRALAESEGAGRRGRLLPAHVEIMTAAGDTEAASRSAQEMEDMAVSLNAPFLHATSDQASGTVLLAKGDIAPALRRLRAAWRCWYELEAPYDAGRVRVLIAAACRALGDEDSASLELDAARQIFERLGALPDLQKVQSLLGASSTGATSGLTGREVEVLRLVAEGKTNHAIATELYISDNTVRRHLQNIFAKLGVPSRAAATAFAIQHHIV